MSPANQKAYFERLYLKIEKCLFVTTFFFFFRFLSLFPMSMRMRPTVMVATFVVIMAVSTAMV